MSRRKSLPLDSYCLFFHNVGVKNTLSDYLKSSQWKIVYKRRRKGEEKKQVAKQTPTQIIKIKAAKSLVTHFHFLWCLTTEQLRDASSR